MNIKKGLKSLRKQFVVSRKHARRVGLDPGALVHTDEKKVEKVIISVIDYNEDTFNEKEVENIKDALDYINRPTVTWINISGLHDVNALSEIGKTLNINSLDLEDVLNTAHRPKLEIYDNYLFVILKMIRHIGETGEIIHEQISCFLVGNTVITLQEQEGDVFNMLKDRIKNIASKVRKMRSDFLFYSLIDSIVDSYFLLLEHLANVMGEIEERTLEQQTKRFLEELFLLKKEVIYLKRSIWPLRDVVNKLKKSESALMSDGMDIYFTDLSDHTIQVIDVVETLSDNLSTVRDMYMSNASNRMNEVMKTLTIIATIFIPLTFIAGIYGMNFEYMPELKWKFGYPLLMCVLLVISLVMICFFRRKKWF